MGETSQIVEIIILAMIAGFIALRLRGVLGRRGPDDHPKGVEKFPGSPKGPKTDPADALGFGRSTFPETKNSPGFTGPHQAAVRKIFGPLGQAGFNKFMAGAKTAYEMTLKGFWAGKMGEMEPYIDPEVLTGFKSAIAARNKEGHIVDNKLVEILDAKLEDAEVEGDSAEITIRFESEIIAVVKDRYGKILEGNLTDTIKVTDLWTFARHLKSKDPNWVLIATEAG